MDNLFVEHGLTVIDFDRMPIDHDMAKRCQDGMSITMDMVVAVGRKGGSWKMGIFLIE